MRITLLAPLISLSLASSFAMADQLDTVLGSAVGAAAGTVIGQSVGGRDGAVIGAALGGATGVILTRDRVRTQTREARAYPVQYVAPVAIPPGHYYYGRKYKLKHWRHHHGERD